MRIKVLVLHSSHYYYGAKGMWILQIDPVLACFSVVLLKLKKNIDPIDHYPQLLRPPQGKRIKKNRGEIMSAHACTSSLQSSTRQSIQMRQDSRLLLYEIIPSCILGVHFYSDIFIFLISKA